MLIVSQVRASPVLPFALPFRTLRLIPACPWAIYFGEAGRFLKGASSLLLLTFPDLPPWEAARGQDELCGGHPLVTSCFTPFTDIFGTRDAVAGPHECVGPFDGGRVMFA
jgi:hypothetical protein